MCKKSSCIIPIILLIIIIALCCYIFLCTDCKCKDNKTNETETKQTVTQDTNYSYKEIAGYYSTKDTVNSGSESLTVGYNLYLYENGTFSYQFLMNAPRGVIGNYIIVDDEIKLNYLFNTGSDASLIATTGSKVLKIKDNNTIVENDAEFAKNGGSKTINLVRDNSNNNKEDNSITDYINNYEVINKTNNN